MGTRDSARFSIYLDYFSCCVAALLAWKLYRYTTYFDTGSNRFPRVLKPGKSVTISNNQGSDPLGSLMDCYLFQTTE